MSDAEHLKGMYDQLCLSYRAIDDFRGKLLGFLPLASGASIALLSSSLLPSVAPEATEAVRQEFHEKQWLLLATGIFGCLVTIGLFAYELFGIKKCAALIGAGQRMERRLNVSYGQFNTRPPSIAGFVSEPFAACVIYSAVLSAWTFVGLASFDRELAVRATVGVFAVSSVVSFLLTDVGRDVLHKAAGRLLHWGRRPVRSHDVAIARACEHLENAEKQLLQVVAVADTRRIYRATIDVVECEDKYSVSVHRHDANPILLDIKRETGNVKLIEPSEKT